MKNYLITFLKIFFCVSLSCLIIQPAFAKAAAPKVLIDDSAKKPLTVIFGVYPTALYAFDPKHDSFKIDFYAWWRSKDKNYDPTKHLEIVNAEKYKFKMGTPTQSDNAYSPNGHYYAKIHQYFDPRNFPFEHITLLVSMEDFDDISKVVFEPDYEQSDIHPEVEIPNWKILNFQLHKSITHYNSNFGDIATPKGLYSRITMQIDIKHNGWVSYFNYFIAFFVTAFLSILLFFLEKESMEVQMLIVVSAIFSFVGNKYVLDNVMADSSSYSLANLIQISTFIALFCGIMFLISEKNIPREESRRRILFYHAFGYVLAVAYIASVGLGTYFAVIS